MIVAGVICVSVCCIEEVEEVGGVSWERMAEDVANPCFEVDALHTLIPLQSGCCTDLQSWLLMVGRIAASTESSG